jgi:hypothetical protein
MSSEIENAEEFPISPSMPPLVPADDDLDGPYEQGHHNHRLGMEFDAGESIRVSGADTPSPRLEPQTPPLGNPQPQNPLDNAIAEFLALSAPTSESSTKPPTLREIAQKWGIHFVTLHRHLTRFKANQYRIERGLPPISIPPRGKKQKLGKRIEDALAKWIQILESLCYPILLKGVISKANEIGFKVYGSGFKPVTYSWWREFTKRYAHLKICASKHPKAVSLAKLVDVNPKAIDDFFDKLEHIIVSKGFDRKPHRIYNVDETGVTLSDDASGLRVVGFRSKTTQVIEFKQSSSHYMSAICTIGATLDSLKVAPFLVIKGNRDPGRRVLFGSDNVDEFDLPGVEYVMSESGFATATVFGDYLRFFARKVGASAEDPVLLLLDGYSAHVTAETINIAAGLGVILFFLPPNSTHATQPLDAVVFSLLKRVFRRMRFEDVFSSGDVVVGGGANVRQKALKLFAKAYLKADPDSLGPRGFEETGLWPLDRTRVFKKLRIGEEDDTLRSHLEAVNRHMTETSEVISSTQEFVMQVSPLFTIHHHVHPKRRGRVVRNMNEEVNNASLRVGVVRSREEIEEVSSSSSEDDEVEEEEEGVYLRGGSRKRSRRDVDYEGYEDLMMPPLLAVDADNC